MKHLFCYIVCFFTLFNSVATAVENISLPEDFEGKVTKYMIENKDNDDDAIETNIGMAAVSLYEITEYLYNKYQNDEIYQEDFTEKLKPFFPDDSEEDLLSKQNWLANGFEIYKQGKKVYLQYIEKFLAPQPHKKVRNFQDYDHDGEVKYIETDNDEFVKVYNFKKFLTYSNNEDEKASISEFERKNKKNLSAADKIYDWMDKLEWKKAFFYGSVYKNPFLSDEGVSELKQGIDVKARLISRSTAVNKQTELDIGVELINQPYSFILANNISPLWLKPQIDLSKSTNIADVKVLYPVPLSTANFLYAHKYFGDFMIPLKIKPQNPEEAVNIVANVQIVVCDSNMTCQPEHFELQLNLAAESKDEYDNGYDNFFFQSLNRIPKADSEVLKLKKFVVDDDKNTQTLRLEFESRKKVNNFKVFIEEVDGYTLFSAPFISLHDNKIYVRFEQLDKTRKADLLQSEFIITAVMNDKYHYRTTQISDSASAFDTNSIKLNLGLIWFAVLGGIILNFMPCVFPVLALKITALSTLRGRRRKELRKSLWLNAGGIFCGFSILIIILLGLRGLGYSLGWGMQFQNISFVVCMALVMSSLIVTLPRFSKNLNNMASKNKISEFLIGNLTVLIATPCTAPYLAAAIGFALSSTNADMIVILYAIALGLAMPYLLILLLKKPETFFPKPGAWTLKLEKITKLLLWLTIIWFLALIYGQTGVVFTTIFAVMLLLFGALLYLCFEFIDYVEYKVQNIGTQHKYKVISGSYIFMLIIVGIFMLVSSYYAQRSYVKQQEINLKQREVSIDQKQIDEYLAQGHPVLLEITSDWCLTCHVNNALVLNKNNLENLHSMYNLELIRVDWTNYNPDILKFMAQYGRKGLPFYILYTPLIREGMVLPEVFNSNDLEQYLTFAIFR